MDATRQSWKNLKPLPDQHALLSFAREFSEVEFEQVRRGFIPERMEDKWFIFYEEDMLFFHRSWTGYCIYQLYLKRADSKIFVSEALVNRDAKQYSWKDAHYDEKLLAFLIGTLLLNQPSPLPIASDVPAGIAAELHVLHTVGAGKRKVEEVPQVITIRGIFIWLWNWLKWLIKG